MPRIVTKSGIGGKKYILLDFCLRGLEFLFIFVGKFIMPDYGAE